MHVSIALQAATVHIPSPPLRPAPCVDESHLPSPSPSPPSGQRHAFLMRYKIGFTKAGLLRAMDVRLYSGAGNSWDLSHAITDRAMLHWWVRGRGGKALREGILHPFPWPLPQRTCATAAQLPHSPATHRLASEPLTAPVFSDS